MCPKSHVPFIKLGAGASDEVVLCVLCDQDRPMTAVTSGPLIDGAQAFACTAHMQNRAEWLAGWARVMVSQRHNDITVARYAQPRYHELRPARTASEQAVDIAHHLYMRHAAGVAAVVAEQPGIFLSVLRKRWFRLLRALQRQRASTLNTQLIKGFDQQIEAMQSLRFRALTLQQQLPGDIYIMRPGEMTLPQECATVYVCSPLGSEKQEAVRRQLALGGVIIEYDANRISSRL